MRCPGIARIVRAPDPVAGVRKPANGHVGQEDCAGVS